MKAFSLLCLLLLALSAASAADPALEIRAVAERSDPYTQEFLLGPTKDTQTEIVYLEPEVLLGIAAVRSALAEFSDASGWVIHVNLTDAGSEQFKTITTKYMNKRLAFVIYGKLRCAPVVRSVIGRSVDIAGNFTTNEAATLAADLNAAVAEAAATPGSR